MTLYIQIYFFFIPFSDKRVCKPPYSLFKNIAEDMSPLAALTIALCSTKDKTVASRCMNTDYVINPIRPELSDYHVRSRGEGAILDYSDFP